MIYPNAKKPTTPEEIAHIFESVRSNLPVARCGEPKIQPPHPTPLTEAKQEELIVLNVQTAILRSL